MLSCCSADETHLDAENIGRKTVQTKTAQVKKGGKAVKKQRLDKLTTTLTTHTTLMAGSFADGRAVAPLVIHEVGMKD